MKTKLLNRDIPVFLKKVDSEIHRMEKWLAQIHQTIWESNTSIYRLINKILPENFQIKLPSVEESVSGSLRYGLQRCAMEERIINLERLSKRLQYAYQNSMDVELEDKDYELIGE